MSKQIRSAEEHRNYMLESPIGSLTLAFSIPSMIATLITSIYNLTDTYFVSTIGTEATAAVGVVFSISMVLVALGFWAGTGASTLISNLLGAGENEKAQRIISSAFWLSTGFGVLVAVICLISGDGLLKAIGATDTILSYAREYAFYILLSAPFSTGTMMLGQSLRAEGLSKESMIGNVTGGVLNMILDPILIFVFHMGIRGAAIATAVSMFIGWTVLVSFYLRGRTRLHLHIRYISRSAEDYIQIFTVGFPSLCRHVCNTLANIVLNRVAGTFGVAPIAAMSICNRLLYLSNAVSGGINNGSQPIIGYAYGCRNMKRVREAFSFAVKVSVGSMIVFGAIGFVFAHPLISFFRDDADVISYGTVAFRLICLSLPFACFNNSSSVLLQVMKKPLLSSLITLGRQAFLYIPMLLILSGILNELGVQLSGPLADVIVGLICIPLILHVSKTEAAEARHAIIIS